MSKNHTVNFHKLTFRSAILNALPANVAVIDAGGEILAVNLGWQDFADANQMQDVSLGIGANYLDICRSAAEDPDAQAALKGIVDVIKGRRSNFYHEYPCHSPDEQRWFALRAAALIDNPDFVAVSHENITERISKRQ